MRSVLTIAKAVLIDAVRRKVVWVVGLFAAILAAAAPVLPSFGQGVAGAVFREVSLALMFVTAFVVAVVLASTRIPAEVERRTVFAVLARDVRRWQYVAGTWLGMFAVVGIVLLGFTAAAIVAGAVVYQEAMLLLLEGALAVWLEMGVVMALTLMMSTRFGPVTSVMGSFVFVFVGHSIGGLVAGESGVTPWYVPSLDLFNVINPVAHGSGYPPVYALSMIAAFAAWVALLLLAAGALFESRDL